MKLTRQEIMELSYLERSYRPLYGGHLQRGQPISDPQLARWVETGLIKAVGTEGYRITDLGRAALEQSKEK